MKLAFSTDIVKKNTFIDLCNICSDYGFAGFEISDADAEKSSHRDSILRPGNVNDAKRKLYNRSVEVCALSYPVPADSDAVTSEKLVSLVETAFASGIERVILFLSDNPSLAAVAEKTAPACRRASETGVRVLFETKGILADTSNAVSLLRLISGTSTGVAWNIRETYFTAGESAETTIKTLGAYIEYVRMGDRLGSSDVLTGEGELPVETFAGALRSLNYDSFVCCDTNSEIRDYDIILTHFSSVLGTGVKTAVKPRETYCNRSETGTFPWKKYEVINKTFSQVLDTMAETYPDQYCFKYTTLDYTRTYKEFRDDVDRAAAAFIALGVKPGYHIAVWATNIPQWFISFWAAAKIGAVLVTVNTAYKIHEVQYLLHQSDTHTLVMIKDCKDTDYSEIMRELCPELEDHKNGTPLYCENLPFLRNIVTVGFKEKGCLEWNEMLALSSTVPAEEVKRRASLVKPDDVCNMQYTSGTTGFPKGVMLTHNNIINNGKIIGDRMDLSTADRMMIQVPMFHCFGMVLSMTSSMTHGVTMSPMPYFSPKSSLSCINREKITCFNGVPTMFIAMFSHADFASTDFSYMRTGIMAGSNCPPELMKRAADEMNMREIISVYGQTEASPGCTMGEVNETLEQRTETVGTAFPGVECKIIDPETGADLPAGENGEFVARGFNIMKGYYKMPEATRQTIDSEGWLHSGDICCKTEDGYYRVTGRLKDMIIRGGENIYPREIEEFYLTSPLVRDVQVIGVPDKRYGEEACAWIILHENASATAEDMTEYGVRHMARHKVPRYFVFVSEFPMNAAGKILKYKMKEESVQLLGL